MSKSPIHPAIMLGLGYSFMVRIWLGHNHSSLWLSGVTWPDVIWCGNYSHPNIQSHNCTDFDQLHASILSAVSAGEVRLHLTECEVVVIAESTTTTISSSSSSKLWNFFAIHWKFNYRYQFQFQHQNNVPNMGNSTSNGIIKRTHLQRFHLQNK